MERQVYHRTHLQRLLTIDRLITMYYFEFGKDYVFRGEDHNFWEFLYVDKGEVEVWADDRCHTLKQGAIIFHRPNEHHRFYAVGGKAPNVIVMTFDCDAEAMRRFESARIVLEAEERNLLAHIVKEGTAAFAVPFTHPLQRRPNAPDGAEQLIQLYLETFLIRLLRREREWKPILTQGRAPEPVEGLLQGPMEGPSQGFGEGGLQGGPSRASAVGSGQGAAQGSPGLPQKLPPGSSPRNRPAPASSSSLALTIRETHEQHMMQRIEAFLASRIDRPLSLRDVSAELQLSKTVLKEMVKRHTGQTVMEMHRALRMQEAKRLIREEACNFTEIAERLRFGSVHHFSKMFKRATGMSPTEYARSVKARL